MIGKTHIFIGLATIAAIDAATGFVEPHLVQAIPAGPFLCIFAGVLGALAPDLDAEEGSQIQYEMGGAGVAISGWLQSFGVQHRGLTHYGVTTVVVIAVVGILGWLLGYMDVGLAFGLGYLSHVLADSMTIKGTPLLWPREKEFHILPSALRVRTGGPLEPLILMVTVALCVFLLPSLLSKEFLDLARHIL